ncbi:MAG: DUF6034 family protein [Lachnospiraceae bacterium]|jgi:hypothetical protein|nr:DUF6034 family protein [Lachnospiraceae bacterium]
MKKSIVSFLTFLFLISFVACQKTPDQPLVKNKNLDQMMEEAVKNPVVAESGELLKALGAPEKLSFRWTGKSGGLTIQADAKLIAPNVASMPVVRVTRATFTESDVKNMYDALRGNAITISPYTEDIDTYYLQQIQEFQVMKENEQFDAKFPTADAIDEYIRILMEQASAAPSEFPEVEPDFSFKQNDDGTKELPLGQYAKLMLLQPDHMTVSSIVVEQDRYGTGAQAQYFRNWSQRRTLEFGDTGNQGDASALSIRQEEAKKIALDTVTSLNSDFACTGERVADLGNGKNAYEFMFTRTFHSAPITYTNDNGDTTLHDAYFKPWMYEKIRVYVDDAGILYLVWTSPYTVKEIVFEKSSMLPFSEIQSVFEQMIGVAHDGWDNNEFYAFEVTITEARLGLMRVTEQDVGDSGLIIPVWDFFGTVTLKGKPGKPNPSEGIDNSYQYTSLLTINAIDGSIIDRELGH